MDKKTDKDAAASPPAEEPAEVPAKKGGIPKIAVIAGILLVQIVVSYLLQKTLFFKDVAGTHEAAAASHKTEKVEAKEEEEAPVVMLDEIVVNPADTGGRRYLAVTVGLQVRGLEADKKIEKKKPLIRDALISLLSSKPFGELARIGYRDSLKVEIRAAANHQLRDSTVTGIVFTGYVLQ